MNSPAQSSKEFFSVKHDTLDPSGTGLRGTTMGHDLTKAAQGHPVVYWRSKDGSVERFMVLDVHALPGTPMVVYAYCPVCNNHLTIKQGHKQMSYDPQGSVRITGFTAEEICQGVGVKDLGGRLSIEHIRCSWEEQPDLRREFGFGVCGWSVVIDNNVARNV
jgi:hypothetical protein